jgi:hypothetical protein
MDALTIRATRSTKTAFSKELALPCLNLNSSLPDSAYVVLTCVHICYAFIRSIVDLQMCQIVGQNAELERR